MASSESSRKTKDLISNVPGIVTDKILELLPISVVARTSLLSTKWRNNWLSLQRLNFDAKFCEEQNNEDGSRNWQKCSNIISSILLHHNGPIYDFHLHIPNDADQKRINLSQWLSFLSKNAVRKITLYNFSGYILVPSYIFWCSELVLLKIFLFCLNPPPSSFRGFPKLLHLELLFVKFTQQDIFCKLMASCKVLATLVLQHCYGMDHIFVDVPSLETLTVLGQFESLTFGDVHNLKELVVSLYGMPETPITAKTVDAFNLLASSCQLESIKFDGQLCQYLASGSIDRPLPVKFDHLNKLCLGDLKLGDFRVLSYVFGMVESCPYIEELNISVSPTKNAKQCKVDCNKSHKLDHLLKVNIEGITGTCAELKLIEYLLAISSVLEKLMFKCGELDTESELKLSRALMGFPRASTKARLICLT